MRLSTIRIEIALIMLITSCYVFCSCQQIDSLEMKSYLNSHSDEIVLEVEQKVDSVQKTAQFTIVMKEDDNDMELERIERFREVLSDYMKNDENSYLNQGYQVVACLQNGSHFGSSAEPQFFAYFSNFEYGVLSYYGDEIVEQETSRDLNTIIFRFDPGDEQSFSVLSDVENLVLAGNYSSDDYEYMDKLFSEINSMPNLKTIRVNQYWYPVFADADLKCVVKEETIFTSFGQF